MPVQFKECFTLELKGCHNDDLITIEKGIDGVMDSVKCIDLCSKDNECNVVVYVPRAPPHKNACKMYRSCAKIREALNMGTTYSKEGK